MEIIVSLVLGTVIATVLFLCLTKPWHYKSLRQYDNALQKAFSYCKPKQFFIRTVLTVSAVLFLTFGACKVVCNPNVKPQNVQNVQTLGEVFKYQDEYNNVLIKDKDLTILYNGTLEKCPKKFNNKIIVSYGVVEDDETNNSICYIIE